MVMKIIFTLDPLRTDGIVQKPLLSGKSAYISSRRNGHIHMPHIIERIGIAVVFQQVFLTWEKFRRCRIGVNIQVNLLEVVKPVIKQRSGIRELPLFA